MYECDGVITSAFETAEPPEGLQAVKSFLANTSRQMYVIGPVLPPIEHTAAIELGEAVNSTEIKHFLDKMLYLHGERSLIYVGRFHSCGSFRSGNSAQISFGTLIYPPKAENVWILIDVLIERNIPFVSPTYCYPLHKYPSILSLDRRSGLCALQNSRRNGK